MLRLDIQEIMLPSALYIAIWQLRRALGEGYSILYLC